MGRASSSVDCNPTGVGYVVVWTRNLLRRVLLGGGDARTGRGGRHLASDVAWRRRRTGLHRRVLGGRLFVVFGRRPGPGRARPTAHLAFVAVKYAGALYLLYLAYKLWSAPARALAEDTGPELAGRRARYSSARSRSR